MNQQSSNRLYGATPAENYQRFFVPAIGEPLADDLIGIAGLRSGQRVLDVACGTGVVTRMAAERVGTAGAVAGLDVNPGMLAVARAKGIYDDLRRMVLGEPLDLPSNHFAAVLACACITPGHAPASCFDELIRVCKPGGLFVFSLRDDGKQLPEYPEAVARHEKSGAWEKVFRTASFQTMPYGEKDVSHRIHVYRVLAE